MRILKWLVFVILLAVLVPGIALFAALQSEPLVSASHRLTQENVGRIKVVMRDADPRWLRVGDSRQLTLVEDDLNMVLNYGMSNFVPGAIQVRLKPSEAQVEVSLAAGSVFKGKFLNTSFNVAGDGGEFIPSDWRLGNLPVPDSLSRALARLGHAALLNRPQYRVGMAALDEIEFGVRQISVRYHWEQELKEQLRITGRQLLFDEHAQERLGFYHEKIFQLSREQPRSGSLTALIAPLFDSAARHSTDADAAVEENRALLLTLAFYLARIDVNHFMTQPGRRLNYYWLLRPTLAQRQDLAKHFVISAGIAASAGNGIAVAAGLFKELKDSQGGSGFSFADLAADQAGTRLAELALDPRTAREVQETMRIAANEQVYMPGIAQLPEGIQQLAFTDRYQNLDNAAYRAVTLEIERRIAQCSLYTM